MGQLVYIILNTQDDKEIEALNKALDEMNINNSFTTNKMNEDWVIDINNNPESRQKHLKPITLEELYKTFPVFTNVGELSFDVAFDRISQIDAEKYAEFIFKYKDQIKNLKGSDELINRFTLPIKVINVIKDLNEIPIEPEMLPLEDRTKDINGGILLCKSWSNQPFWIIFGNVESPMFMKNRIYKDDIYNNIYRDKKGYAYLIIPLMPINNNSIDFAYKIYEEAYSLGLRESPNFFLPMVYGINVINYNSVVEDYNKYYSQDEIIDKFEKTFNIVLSIFPYNNYNGIIWNDVIKSFKPININPTSKHLAYCSVLTCLIRAIENKNTCADILSYCTGKKYSKIEF